MDPQVRVLFCSVLGPLCSCADGLHDPARGPAGGASVGSGGGRGELLLCSLCSVLFLVCSALAQMAPPSPPACAPSHKAPARPELSCLVQSSLTALRYQTSTAASPTGQGKPHRISVLNSRPASPSGTPSSPSLRPRSCAPPCAPPRHPPPAENHQVPERVRRAARAAHRAGAAGVPGVDPGGWPAGPPTVRLLLFCSYSIRGQCLYPSVTDQVWSVLGNSVYVFLTPLQQRFIEPYISRPPYPCHPSCVDSAGAESHRKGEAGTRWLWPPLFLTLL